MHRGRSREEGATRARAMRAKHIRSRCAGPWQSCTCRNLARRRGPCTTGSSS